MIGQTSWPDAAFGILTRTLGKEKNSFCDSMETLYQFVKEKHSGRCVSKSLFVDSKRAEMIQKLFKSYCQRASVYELCRSQFMRKLTHHNSENNDNLKWIAKIIVPLQVQNMSDSEKLFQDDDALKWLRDFDATIIDPSKINQEKNILTRMSEAELQQLGIPRSKIEEQLKEQMNRNDYQREEVIKIIEGITTPNYEQTKTPGLGIQKSRDL